MISQKSRLASLLLCLFLGMFGLHRMYVGKIGTGLIQLFLTVTGLGVMFSAIWVLIDFIAIAAGISRDRAGNFVRNWDARI